MPNELREKLIRLLAGAMQGVVTADDILSLIESERCVWTFKDGEFTMSCGETVQEYDEEGVWVKDDMPPYCWHCGKRIEVKDAT